MNAQRFEGINYGYRPDSYWDTPGPLQMILQNVQGAHRRKMIRDYWEAGRIEELADSHLLDSLSAEQRARLEQIHPTFMGGEYLPDYRAGESEIARIELKSTTADVISVRAKSNGVRIEYSISDEYGTEFEVSPASSSRPLTLDELIAVIDGAGFSESLAIDYTVMNYENGPRTEGESRRAEALHRGRIAVLPTSHGPLPAISAIVVSRGKEATRSLRTRQDGVTFGNSATSPCGDIIKF